MSRKRILSDSEREERQRMFNKKTTERRSILYQSDEAYRDQIKDASRALYRKQRGIGSYNARSANASLKTIETMGRSRNIYGRIEPMITFSISEMAEVLGGYNPNVIRVWTRDGRFPKPQLPAVLSGRLFVYSLSQAEALARVMGEHQRSKCYLGKEDKETIGKLFSAMESTS